MATKDLGEIQEVNIREIWPHEAHNFTTWLFQADNLALLGNAVGLNLEPVRQEAPVGYFWLDILAKEGSHGELVAIENQLEPTDHSHLGQSLTYAAENRVGYVIWIASYFRPEHKKAIDWLNSLAPGKVWFFAVEIHAIQIGDSQPAADFRPVAVPANWPGGIGRTVIPSRPSLEDSQLYLEFFQPLVDQLNKAGFTDETEAKPDRDQEFPSGLRDWISYHAGFDDDGAWVYLWFLGGPGKRDFTNRVFDALDGDWEQGEWEQIENEFAGEWDWDRRSTWWYFSVSLKRDGSINDPPLALDEIRAWMLETLPKFRDVFNPRLEKILSELEEV